MNKYTYRVSRDVALKVYEEHGMLFDLDLPDFNGLLIIEAVDEASADKIRMTFTDITMWEKVEE
jgi:hypothetical protein